MAATLTSETIDPTTPTINCLLCSSSVQAAYSFNDRPQTDVLLGDLCKCLDLPHVSFLAVLQDDSLCYCSACVTRLQEVHELYLKLEDTLRKIDAMRNAIKEDLQAAHDQHIRNVRHENATDFHFGITESVRKQVIDAINLKSKYQMLALEESDFITSNTNHLIIVGEDCMKQEIKFEDEVGTADPYLHDDWNHEADKIGGTDPISENQLISEITSGKRKLVIKVMKLDSDGSETSAESAKLVKRRKVASGNLQQKSKSSGRSPGNIRPSSASLARRKRAKTRKTADFACHIEGCEARFKSDYKRVAHLRLRHKGEWKPFKCDICGLGYHRRYLLTYHLTKHTGEKPFVCEQCGSAFRRNSYLNKHLMTNHRNISENHRKSYGTKLPCSICEKTFPSKTALQNHFVSHTGEKEYLCELCSCSYRRIDYLRNHHRQCHAAELNLTELRCRICSKIFSTSSYLKIHERLHTGENIPFHCDQCPFRCFGKVHFEIHLRQHSSERPFACTVEGCSATYKHKAQLEGHIRRHNNERRHSCKECGASFFCTRTLKNHIAAIHCPNSEELCAKNKCEICGQGFPLRKYLMRHIQKHRDGKLPSTSNVELPS